MDENLNAGIAKAIAASKRGAAIYILLMILNIGMAGYHFMSGHIALALMFTFTACLSLWVAVLSRRTARAMQKLV